MRGFKSRLLTLSLLVALTTVTTVTGSTGASAAARPARPTDAQMKTLNPETACVRGPARPFIAAIDPTPSVFVPPEEMGAPAVTVEYRISTIYNGQVVWTGQSNPRTPGFWLQPQLRPELASDMTYGWQARVFNGTTYSLWSKRCEFTTDTTRPNSPGLTITPDGPYHVGQQIALHFTNAGSTDVTKYGYAVMDDVPRATVDAGVGTATVTLEAIGPTPIRAWSYDRAGYNSLPTIVDININP
jgi:hypothetical protein